MNTRKRLILTGTMMVGLIISVGYWRHASASKGIVGQVSGDRANGRPGVQSIPAGLFEVHKDILPDAIDGLIGTIKGNTLELTFNGQEERLIAAHVQVGQRVKKGEVLFELDHLRTASRKSQAESNLARAKELLDAGGATTHDVEEAQAAFDLAQKDYDDTFIVAPQSGIVSQINRQVGETVGRNEVAAILVSSNERFYVETGVIEGQIEQVAEGQRAVVEIEAFGSAPIEARVRGVSREVTTTGRTGTVLVSLPWELQFKVRPGMSARCKIYVYNAATYPIPRTAYDQEKQGIYVIGQDQKAHFLKVALGHVTRDYYGIAEGLHDGDRIVNDLAATPVEDNAAIKAEGDVSHYKNPEAPAEKS